MTQKVNGVYVDDFHCEQNFMSNWYPRLSELDVPQPDTYIFEIYDESIDFDKIKGAMESEGWQIAFIRGDGFSDKVNPRTGARITEPTLSEIERTYETMKNHLINYLDTPLGEIVAVREWLDLDYCKDDAFDHRHPNELRYIVEDGNIQYVMPSLEVLKEINTLHECTYGYIEDKLYEEDLEEPYRYAKRVAQEFDDYSWHVDFCLDTNFDWYCIDMGLNGVYWSDEKEKWIAMTGQPDSVEQDMISRVKEGVESHEQI